jgi:hypothetical protein
VSGALLLYLAVGAGAGLLAGLLGVGGGLIIVAALAVILPAHGVPHAHVMHVALATSMASIVATSLSSAWAHWRRGGVLWPSVLRLLPGLLLGGVAGALIADRLAGLVLRLGVVLFCFLAAWQLLRPRRAADGAEVVPRSPLLAAWGVLIGAVSALVGIGGGSMTVPLLIAHGARPVHAVGSSAACGLPIAVASALGYAFSGADAVGLPAHSLGYVYPPAAAGIALASVAAAPLGAALAHRLHGATLERVFAGFLVLVGISLLVGANGA